MAHYRRNKPRTRVRCKLCTKHRDGNKKANLHPSMIRSNMTAQEEGVR